MTDQTKFTLTEDRIPTHWVNLLPDLPGEPLPPLSPATMEPAGPDDLTPIFPMEIIGQEVSMDPEVEIPEPVRDAYRLWRPTPLFRAHRLERALDTPAHIYYKYEGVSPAGSHKPNSAVAQAYANKQAGVKRLVTETGAGQWGSALAMACAQFGLECVVYMVGASYDQKPYRRAMMESWGATVIRSPSDTTEAGRSQASHPTGSLGIAISEAVEVAAGDAETNYALGSGAQPRLPAPDGDRPGGDRPDGDGGRGARRGGGLRRRRLELRGAHLSRTCAASCATGRRPASSRRSRRPARRSRAGRTATTSATPSASRR